MDKSIPEEIRDSFLEKVKKQKLLNEKGKELLRKALSAEKIKRADVTSSIEKGASREDS